MSTGSNRNPMTKHGVDSKLPELEMPLSPAHSGLGFGKLQSTILEPSKKPD